MTSLDLDFLAAPALGLPWLLTDWLNVRDSKPSIPYRNIAKLRGLMHMEVDEVADMMIDMEVDKVADKVAGMVMNILFWTK